jgi:hypothetical protein
MSSAAPIWMASPGSDRHAVPQVRGDQVQIVCASDSMSSRIISSTSVGVSGVSFVCQAFRPRGTR